MQQNTTSSVEPKLATRIRRRCTRALGFASDDLFSAIDAENWAAAGRVARSGSRNALQLAMLELRQHGNKSEALDYLQESLRLCNFLRDVIFKIPSNVIPASRFDIPLFCCLLSKEIGVARTLAEFVIEGRAKVVNGSHFDVHAQILSAFVLDDLGAFEKGITDFKNLDVIYWWEKQNIYFELYRTVLGEDEIAFNGLLKEAIAAFGNRASDREFGDQLSEYGGLENNQFAIDFMATGIVIVARSRGMKVDIDDHRFLPAELIR